MDTWQLDENAVARFEQVALGIADASTLQPPGGATDVTLLDPEGVTVAVVREGRLEVLQPPPWPGPAEVRDQADARGWGELTAVVGAEPPDDLPSGHLLLLVPVGGARPDDPHAAARLRRWRRLVETRDALLVPVPVRPDEAAARAGELASAYGASAHVRGRDPAPGHRTTSGVTVFFTGLSGSGKSTIARALVARVLDETDRTVTLLDGDVVRTHLSKGLGFSRADRDTNIRRIGWVAAEVTKHGGMAVCAPIAPYDATRKDVRRMVESAGGDGAFVLVHVATPLEECERRDRKGLYAKARAGEIAEFTGISDPYEEPTDAEVVVDTRGTSPEEAAAAVVERLRTVGRLGAP